MEIDHDLILKLEALAQLELTESERIQMQLDLKNILHMVDKLRDINTDGLEPLVHLGTDHAPFRDDVAGEQFSASEAVQNAGLKDDHYFLVPKVIEK